MSQEIIYELLKRNANKKYTAKEIFDEIQRTLDISSADTIYRALRKMREYGLVNCDILQSVTKNVKIYWIEPDGRTKRNKTMD